MIARIIVWSLANRFLVLLLALLLAGWGVYAVNKTAVDAIPDLSDVQVIIKTTYPGQAPQVVEDQVTYPLTTVMLAAPGAVRVYGYSFFGDSYVYVLFEDGTDLYWARSRVLEYLNQVSERLPREARPALGPDATGVGWVYEYALADRSGKHDLAQLRSLQDWFLKFELRSVPGVAEVATLGGMVKQYQVIVHPARLRAYNLDLSALRNAIERAGQESGGAVIEMAEAEYLIRARGYITGIEDLRAVPLGITQNGTPVLLEDVAEIRIGPELRQGIAELNGEGEVVGGIVVMRSGKNAQQVIKGVKAKLAELKKQLPEGVEIIETYDRSGLIERAVSNLTQKLIEEFIVVALVCLAFLFHLRSALVAVVSLPLGILAAYIVMHHQGINANIMSLGGIAIAIGAMVDAAIVMIENAHKHLERDSGQDHWAIMQKAATEVGPPLFFALLIITLSFLPVFTLEAQEGRLFAPLAYTKTYAMAAAAGLSITLVPVLMGYFIRGRIAPEQKNPLNRALIRAYRPLVARLLHTPKTVLVVSLLLVLSIAWPLSRLGSEFMPDMDEGDLMYMPTLLPGVSIGKAQEFLQQSDKLIKTVPEVKSVFGKVGRADTATDPAPLTMLETLIQFKPGDQWRPGMTPEKLRQELDRVVRFPGVSNVWVMPIKTRIDMLATGIKTPLGVKIAGPDLKQIEDLGKQIEQALRKVPGTASAYAERVTGGRYINIAIDRRAAARFNLNIAGVHEVVRTAIGGMNVAESVEGRERYPVNLRYPQQVRDSVEQLRQLPIVTPAGAHIPLGQVARIEIADGPDMIKSENARLSGWVYAYIEGRDLGSYVQDAKRALQDELKLPPGYTLTWAGQYQYLERARERLQYVIPVTLAIILLLLYLSFRNFTQACMVLGAVPLALIGGFWILYLLGYNLSVAVGVGLIALAGLSAEFGVVMLVYLDQACKRLQPKTLIELRAAVMEGAVMRVRPLAMTASVIIAGLLPIMIGAGAGSEVMKRIAAPMVGGMITAPLVSLFLIPVLYLLWKGRKLSP
ncbi:MAG: efflux RND transporter permease subunit [Gammaproteobacteria bacterium]|nr:MAG: efflux RND transporter permease subunit [Gammaproteobacteria bacterium]